MKKGWLTLEVYGGCLKELSNKEKALLVYLKGAHSCLGKWSIKIRLHLRSVDAIFVALSNATFVARVKLAGDFCAIRSAVFAAICCSFPNITVKLHHMFETSATSRGKSRPNGT